MDRLASGLGRLARLLGSPSPQADDAVSTSTSLSELQAQIDTLDVERTEPIRTVHHFACAGGTLISKCLAAMPNVHLLSEVDPLSDLLHRDEHRFHPTDLTELLRFGTREVGDDVVAQAFVQGIGYLHEELTEAGRFLVLRDHAHSHYCVSERVRERPTLKAMLERRFATTSVVTVRHPLDSYMSLQKNEWLHFSPQTVDEYARRYLMFLDAYRDEPLYRYEDFVSDPSRVMEKMCIDLGLPFNPLFRKTFSMFKLSGDSGRTSEVIAPRPRRLPSSRLMREFEVSQTVNELCARLGYDV